MKNIVIKSFVFIVLYIAATVAISFYKYGKEIVATLSERWYEYIILFFVIVWYNRFIDKKSKRANKNKFYKDL